MPPWVSCWKISESILAPPPRYHFSGLTMRINLPDQNGQANSERYEGFHDNLDLCQEDTEKSKLKTEEQKSFVGCGNCFIYTITWQLAQQLTPPQSHHSVGLHTRTTSSNMSRSGRNMLPPPHPHFIRSHVSTTSTDTLE